MAATPFTGPTPWFDSWQQAMQAKDIEALAAMLAADWKITIHSSGKVLSKDEWVANFGTAIDLLKAERARCIYENAEICVQALVRACAGARLTVCCTPSAFLCQVPVRRNGCGHVRRDTKGRPGSAHRDR